MNSATDNTEALQAVTPPAHGEIWPGQGGRFICSLPALMGVPARALVAGLEESPGRLTFGPYGEIANAGSHIDGPANTVAILAAPGDHPAAQWARAYSADGHTDFFLPARLDMVMAHICAREHFEESSWYWTSTQTSRSDAFVQDFQDGGSDWSLKSFEFRVRACRWVHLTT